MAVHGLGLVGPRQVRAPPGYRSLRPLFIFAQAQHGPEVPCSSFAHPIYVKPKPANLVERVGLGRALYCYSVM